MKTKISVNDFEVEIDAQKNVAGNSENDGVFIKNTESGRVLVVPFADVANFYGFEEVHQPSEVEISRAAEPAETDGLEESIMEPESVDVQPSESTNYSKMVFFQWNEEQTKFMLNEYGKLASCVGRYKRFNTKKLMWGHIAKKLENKFKIQLTAKQVETRYKVIIQRKLKGLNKNKTKPKLKCEEDPIYVDKISSPSRFLKKSHLFIMSSATSTSDSFGAGPSLSQISTSPPTSPILTSVPELAPFRSTSEPDNNRISIHQTQMYFNSEPAETDGLEESRMEPESVDVQQSESTNYSKMVFFQWNEEQTKFMLNEYGKLASCVGRYKRFNTKKLMWGHIAKKLENKFKIQLTAKQVETRYKVIIQRKLKGLNKNKTKPKLKKCEEDPIYVDKIFSPSRFLKKSHLFITSDSFGAGPSLSQISTSPPTSPILTSVPELAPFRSTSEPDNNRISIHQTQSFQEIILERLANQRNKHICQYFEMKDRIEEERLQQYRMYNDAKLQVLRSMVAKSKKDNKSESE